MPKIKPIPKPKKHRDQTIKYWRNKADKQIQEMGRDMYKVCEVCGGEYSCLHHFFPKSTSTHLRYKWTNLIPLCAGCHLKHHNGNPEIHATIIERRGMEWYEDLRITKKNNIYTNVSYNWYKNIYKNLKILEPHRVF